ncbi:DMT family transporter [Helicobacter anatolicus]|uniref:DMT family transporter n=1 Tax=Helicobacter anatolicus TaxID=2905874 RepID=UPI001E4A8AE7|nr:multidrug efflux SMR transporter [Helicobacter anatolicus]MCE3038503.1 multidrug efflux SMR transporter [Helicobacter anatolicus]MCE3040013.1 multidrug efflux SMR transporter [Helicobacter anatolicus]
MSATKKAWIFLIIAIIAEVLGSSSLKMFEDNYLLKYLLMGGFITFSYFFVGMAVKHISIGLAYAMWEALGVVLISLIGMVFFGENLSIYQKIGILFSVVGIIFINFGERE